MLWTTFQCPATESTGGHTIPVLSLLQGVRGLVLEWCGLSGDGWGLRVGINGRHGPPPNPLKQNKEFYTRYPVDAAVWTREQPFRPRAGVGSSRISLRRNIGLGGVTQCTCHLKFFEEGGPGTRWTRQKSVDKEEKKTVEASTEPNLRTSSPPV